MGDSDRTGLGASVLIFSPVGSGNALGRALSLADLAIDLAPKVEVWAPDDGALWPGAARYPIEVRRFRRATEIALPDPSVPLILWAVKPLNTSWGAVKTVARRRGGATLILDIDDDDESLSREFASRSLLNRLRLHPASQLNPARIRKVKARAFAAAHGLTFATHALRAGLGATEIEPALRIPHPRRTADGSPTCGTSDSSQIGVGFFGTTRSHKGLDAIRELVRSDDRFCLNVFENQSDAWDEVPPQQLRQHPADAPWTELFKRVDFVVLPQGRTHGAGVQLPAKLLDAMRIGVPVLTTPTQAILEVAGDTPVYVTDWSDPKLVEAGVRRLSAESRARGIASRERFERELSVERLISPVGEFLETIRATVDS